MMATKITIKSILYTKIDLKIVLIGQNKSLIQRMMILEQICVPIAMYSRKTCVPI